MAGSSGRRGSTLEREVTRGRASGGPGTGARAVGGGGGRRKRPLWPLLLGLLALIALAALLIALLGGGDDDGEPQTAGQAGQPSQQGQAGTSGDAQAPAQTQAGSAGELTAGGTALLPLPDGGLADIAGQDAQGRGVVIQSVVRSRQDPDRAEGFWVGTSAQDRVYVEYGGQVGGDEGDFNPEVGQRVDLEGPLRPAPQEAARVLKLDEEDAALVEQQGAYVNADEVTPAG